MFLLGDNPENLLGKFNFNIFKWLKLFPIWLLFLPKNSQKYFL